MMGQTGCESDAMSFQAAGWSDTKRSGTRSEVNQTGSRIIQRKLNTTTKHHTTSFSGPDGEL